MCVRRQPDGGEATIEAASARFAAANLPLHSSDGSAVEKYRSARSDDTAAGDLDRSLAGGAKDYVPARDRTGANFQEWLAVAYACSSVAGGGADERAEVSLNARIDR